MFYPRQYAIAQTKGRGMSTHHLHVRLYYSAKFVSHGIRQNNKLPFFTNWIAVRAGDASGELPVSSRFNFAILGLVNDFKRSDFSLFFGMTLLVGVLLQLVDCSTMTSGLSSFCDASLGVLLDEGRSEDLIIVMTGRPATCDFFFDLSSTSSAGAIGAGRAGRPPVLRWSTTVLKNHRSRHDEQPTLTPEFWITPYAFPITNGSSVPKSTDTAPLHFDKI